MAPTSSVRVMPPVGSFTVPSATWRTCGVRLTEFFTTTLVGSSAPTQVALGQGGGPVSATFKGRVELSDMVPPESYRIAGEGKGGVAGFAKGGATVRLEETSEGTELIYDVDGKVGGKIAQLGSRLIDSFAAKMADAFFENFKNTVEGSETAES